MEMDDDLVLTRKGYRRYRQEEDSDLENERCDKDFKALVKAQQGKYKHQGSCASAQLPEQDPEL